jgi:hypothetical protein
MQKINNEITISAIVSKQNSPFNILNKEKFGDLLNDNNTEDDTASYETTREVDIFMQSLQNTAQLNRMIIESVA